MSIKRLIGFIALSSLAGSALANVTPADGFYFGGIAGASSGISNANFTIDQTQFVYIVNAPLNPPGSTCNPNQLPFVFAKPGNPNYSTGGGGGTPSTSVGGGVFLTNCGGSTAAPGSLNYRVGGDAGGQIGYRWGHIRGELEYLFDKNTYRSMTINGFEYTRGTDQPVNTIGVGGFTESNSLFVNAYYDFFTPDAQSDLSLVPYVGAGIGYSQVVNKVQFSETACAVSNPDCTGTGLVNPFFSNTASFHNTGGAYQAIIGVAYYIDTDTSFSFDYRYVSTPTFQNGGVSSSSFASLKPSNRFNISTINFTMNFNLDGIMGD